MLDSYLLKFTICIHVFVWLCGRCLVHRTIQSLLLNKVMYKFKKHMIAKVMQSFVSCLYMTTTSQSQSSDNLIVTKLSICHSLNSQSVTLSYLSNCKSICQSVTLSISQTLNLAINQIYQYVILSTSHDIVSYSPICQIVCLLIYQCVNLSHNLSIC